MTIFSYVLIAALLLMVGAAFGFLGATVRALREPLPPPSIDPATVEQIVLQTTQETIKQCIAAFQFVVRREMAQSFESDPGQTARAAEHEQFVRDLREQFPELAAYLDADTQEETH